MSEHPNVVTTRTGIEAFVKGDVATLSAMIADDVVWHAPGSNPYSGTFTGKEETMTRMGRLAQEGVVISFDIHDVVGNDEHVVAMVDATVTKGSSSTHGRQVQVFHVRDGKMTEFWGYNEDQAAVDTVLSS
jgi:ketosteroid isomerase-like protein